MIRIVYIKLLGGWFVVRGPRRPRRRRRYAWSPLSGPFATKAEAQAWLNRKNAS